MKHHKRNRTLGRVRKQRQALLNSLASSLVLHEKIQTTEAKAKELRPFIERMVTRAKKQDLAARRFIISKIGERPGSKLVNDIAPKYKDRNGGYTRIIKLSTPRSDAAKMAHIEFV